MGEAPRSWAASKVCGFNCLSFGITLSITYGMLKVMCAKRTLVKPRVKFKATKINIKEIPVTISAFNIGILVIAISMVLGVLFMLFIAIAAAVPRMVAIRAEEKAMIKVVYRADIMDSF